MKQHKNNTNSNNNNNNQCHAMQTNRQTIVELRKIITIIFQ